MMFATRYVLYLGSMGIKEFRVSASMRFVLLKNLFNSEFGPQCFECSSCIFMHVHFGVPVTQFKHFWVPEQKMVVIDLVKHSRVDNNKSGDYCLSFLNRPNKKTERFYLHFYGFNQKDFFCFQITLKIFFHRLKHISFCQSKMAEFCKQANKQQKDWSGFVVSILL